MSKNCYDCIFALDARETIRDGEQVRCQKAEELFGTDNIKGGQRWVNVQKSEKTGKLINSKCGTFEPFVGNTEIPEGLTLPEPKKVRKPCTNCNGTGKVVVRVMNDNQRVDCRHCGGKGRVEVEEEIQ